MPEPRPARLWVLPLVLLAAAVASFALYNTAASAAAKVLFFPYVAILTCGPLVAYPWLRRRGAGPVRATAGSLCVPGLWLAKECYSVGRIFGPAEAAFYALNPLCVGLFTWVAFELAAAEVVLRRIWRGRWELRSGAAILCAGILAIGAAFLAIARSYGPTVAFDAYIVLYRHLFPR